MKTTTSIFLAALAVECAFATAYTWTGGGTPNDDGSLNWSDGANWGVATAAFPGQTAAGKASTGDTVTFPVGVSTNVRINVSTTITTFTLSATNLVITSDGGRVLTLKGNLTPNAESSLTLDGASIVATASSTTLAKDASLRLLNGATLSLKAMRMNVNTTGYSATAYIGGRSILSIVDTGTCICLGGDAILILDDATLTCRGHVYVNDTSGTGGGRIVCMGAHPLMTVSGSNFRSENNASRTRGADFDFLVPAGGFPEAPIQHLSSSQAFLNGADKCTVPMRFNILPESPAIADGAAIDVPLVSSALAMTPSKMTLGDLYCGVIQMTLDNSKKSIRVHIANPSRKLSVVVEPAFAEGLQFPSSGFEELDAGTNITLSAVQVVTPYGTATPRGFRLYDVDANTGARSEVAGSPFLGATQVYTHTNNWREVRWLWDWTGQGDIFVSTLGDDTNDGHSWDSAKLTPGGALSAAADNSLILFGNGKFNVSSQISLARPLTMASLNGRDNTMFYGHFAARMVSMSHDSATMRGITLASDYAEGTYGGLTISKGTFVDGAIKNFYTGLSKTSGSAINMSGGLVTNCVLRNNYLKTSGGSNCGATIYMTGGKLLNCEVVGNSGSGGGTAARGGTINISGGTVRNCLVAQNNIPERTCGIYATGGTVENCTIVSNRCLSSTASGGLYVAGATFRNCIVYGNRNSNGICDHFLGTGYTFENCCCPDELPGTGNIVTPPEFVDELAGDYRLASGPCIDGGIGSDWMNGAVDLDGKARVIGDAVDIGCYEYSPSALVASIVPSVTYGVESATVDFSVAAKGTNTTGLVCSWAFEDGETFDIVDGTSNVVSHTYSSPGRYSVRLVVRNSAGEIADVVETGLISISPSVVYVAYNSGNPVFPYGSPETAAVHMEDAMDIAGDGVLVRVAAGTNIVPAKIIVLTSTRIVGEGPEKTFFTTAGGSHPVFSLGNPGAVLSSLTVYGSQLGGVFIRDGGTVTNCVIRDNSYNAGAGGAGIQMYNTATVVDSIIKNNYVHVSAGTTRRGGGIYADGSHCLIERCAVIGNSIGSGSAAKPGTGILISGAVVVRDCLVARNYNVTGDTGAYAAVAVASGSAVIENCTIVSNTVTAASGGVSGLYVDSTAAATIRNCIVTDNMTGHSISNIFASVGSKVYATYDHVLTDAPYAAKLNANITAGKHRGGGNFGADPRFRNVAIGDYRLRFNSPAVNAGSFREWMANSIDLDGKPRIYGKAVDIGCYEVQTSAASVLMVQ